MPERRDFLKTLGAGALGAATAGFSTPPAASRLDESPEQTQTTQQAPMNWVWMTPELEVSNDEWKRRFERLREHNVDAILPQVYGSGIVLFSAGSMNESLWTAFEEATSMA